MPLVPFQLLPWCWIPEWVSLYVLSPLGPLRGVSWESCSFFRRPNPHWFLQPEVMGSELPGTGTLGWVAWSGAGIPCSRGIFPYFYPPYVDVGPSFHVSMPLWTSPTLCASPCISMSLLLLPVWMNVASLNSWLLDFYTARFSDESVWYLFYSLIVIFVNGLRRRNMFTNISISTGSPLFQNNLSLIEYQSYCNYITE